MPTSTDQELAAITLAVAAHQGQVDKIGQPYVAHLARVAARLDGRALRTIAWLHDIVEDTGITAQDLRDAGFDEIIVAAVVAITHLPNEPNTEYLARVKHHALARLVKLADVADNSDPARLARLDDETRLRLERKYELARSILTD